VSDVSVERSVPEAPPSAHTVTVASKVTYCCVMTRWPTAAATSGDGHSTPGTHLRLQPPAAADDEISVVRSDDQANAAGNAPVEYAGDPNELRYLAGVTTVEDFVRDYHPFIGETTLLFPADGELTVGDERGLAILLAGGEVALRARCKATEMVTRQGDAPGLGAIRARIVDVEPSSRIVYHELLEAARRHGKPADSGETPPLQGLHDLMSALEAVEQPTPEPPANEFATAVPTRESRVDPDLLSTSAEPETPSEPTVPTVPAVRTAVAPPLQGVGSTMVPEDMTLVATMTNPVLPDGDPDDSAPRVLNPAVVAALNTLIPKGEGKSLTARVSGTEEATRAAPLTSSALASLSMRALADAKAPKAEPEAAPAVAPATAPAPAQAPQLSLARRLIPAAVACLISFGVGFYLRGVFTPAPAHVPAGVIAPAPAKAPIAAGPVVVPAVAAKPAPAIPAAAPPPPTEVIAVPATATPAAAAPADDHE
jgi:hypothetical protein